MLRGLRPHHVIWVTIPVALLAAMFVWVFRRDMVHIPIFAPWGSTAEVNEATICFSQFRISDTSMSVNVQSATCLSSSCTQRYLTFADAWVSDLTRSIHFNSKFVYQPNPDPNARCTADCGGVGYQTVPIGPLTPGKYSLWLGTTWVGELEVRTDGRETGGGCVSPMTRGARLPDLSDASSSTSVEVVPAYPVPTESPGLAPGYP